MANYEVLFTGAGPFRKGDVISDAQIKDAGFDVDHWKGHGAIEETSASTTKASTVDTSKEDEANNTPKTFAERLAEVVGATNATALDEAGFTSEETLTGASYAALDEVEGIGVATIKNLEAEFGFTAATE